MDLCAYTLVLVETLIHFVWKKWNSKPQEVQEQEQDPQSTTTLPQYDPLLTSVWPFYDSVQRTFEKRPSRTLQPKDFTQLVEALHPREGH